MASKKMGGVKMGKGGSESVSSIQQGIRSPMNGFEQQRHQVIPSILGKVAGGKGNANKK